jgi:hypothetical protein
MKMDCTIGVMHATDPVVARQLIAKPRARARPVGNWASHPGKVFLPQLGERFWEGETRQPKVHHI